MPHARHVGVALTEPEFRWTRWKGVRTSRGASVRLIQPDGDRGEPLTGVPAELQPCPGLLVHELGEAYGAAMHRETEPPEVTRAGPLAEHHRVVGKDDTNHAATGSAPERANRYAPLDQLVEAGVEERLGVVGVLGPDPFERLV